MMFVMRQVRFQLKQAQAVTLFLGVPCGTPSFEFQLKHAQAVTKRVDSFVHPKFGSYAIFGDVDAVSEPHL